MSQVLRAVGRIRLAVCAGPVAVVAVHELGAPAAVRQEWLHHAQSTWGAWAYAQRGHAPSGWVAGGLYRPSDFAIDLIRLVREVVAQPAVLVGEGSGGLVALLAAAAAPQWVRGLHLQAGTGQGWGADVARLIGDDTAVNPAWLRAASGPRPGGPQSGDDPLLACGPVERLLVAAVRAAAGHVRAPWSVSGPHFLAGYLPAEGRAAVPLVKRQGPVVETNDRSVENLEVPADGSAIA